MVQILVRNSQVSLPVLLKVNGVALLLRNHAILTTDDSSNHERIANEAIVFDTDNLSRKAIKTKEKPVIIPLLTARQDMERQLVVVSRPEPPNKC